MSLQERWADTTIASKSQIARWLVVQCEAGSSPSCDAQRVDAVSVHGSQNVFIRYEEPSTELDSDNGIARVRVIRGDVHDQKDVLVQLSMALELLTLNVTASKQIVEVVLLRKNQLQRVVNEGSGDVIAEDNVLATMGPSLSIAALGSGDIFATSTEPVRVDTLGLSSKGSGLLQTSFSEIRVFTLRVEYYASGDMVLFVDSESDADNVAVIAEGSGDVCFNWRSPMSINQFEVEQVGSGDVTIGLQGSCQSAKLSMQGLGELDVGGMQCDTVDVDLMSNGKLVVQAINTLVVEAHGNGVVQFAGAAPHAVASIGYTQIYPTPVTDSYLPAQCERHKVPVFKSKVAARSTGILISAELDSAESGSSVAVHSDAVGVVRDMTNRDKDNIIPLAALVFVVALVLRWFNHSRRRAREEQREPLLGARRRVYV